MRSRWVVGRGDLAVAVGSKAELLEALDIELEDDPVRCADEADFGGPVEVALVGVLHVALVGRQFVGIEAAVLDVFFKLVRVWRALAELVAVLAAEAGQRADAGAAALVVDDVV